MIRIIRWIGGFFEDQEGSASSKRALGYIAMIYLGLIVKGSLEDKVINEYVLFAVVGIILFSIGAITSEFFTKYGIRKDIDGNKDINNATKL